MSADRAYRLWRQAGLQVPRRRPRRRIATSRPRPLPATAINHVWAYDFVFDTCADGQTLKCLTVIDEFTRECLAIDVAGGIRSTRVIEVLTPAGEPARRAPLSAVRQRTGVCRQGRRCAGCWPRRSRRRSSTPASRGRMASTNRSMGSSGTSISRCSGFAPAPKRRSASSSGGTITTKSDRTRVSRIKHRTSSRRSQRRTPGRGARRRRRLALNRTKTGQTNQRTN